MFEKIKQRVTHVSKETVKEEAKKHLPEIFTGVSIVLLAYLCAKVNGKPVNITINLNGGAAWAM